MLTVFTYAMLPMMLLSILFSLLQCLCFVANDVALYLTFVNSELCPCANEVSDATQYEHLYCLYRYAHWVLMMPLCSKFLIKWWSTCSETYCLCRYAHYFYRCSLFWYMLTEFTYAHCFDICSLFLYMLTIFIYAHWVYISSLFLHMLTVFICGHCFYIRSLSLHMVTVFIYAHWVYICSMFWYMLTVFIYAH
jgi:hypothetical protein